jgi:hypothetical protein
MPSLPTEVLAQASSNMNDFTLWVVCRRLSRITKAEAEREFATQRLGQLRASFATRDAPSRWSHGISVSLRVLRPLSADGERALFEAKFSVHKAIPLTRSNQIVNNYCPTLRHFFVHDSRAPISRGGSVLAPNYDDISVPEVK